MKVICKHYCLLTALMGLFLIIAGSCSENKIKSDNQYLRWVDDIAKDSSLDNKNFKICSDENYVKQYFNNGTGLDYEGGKSAIEAIFKKEYKTIPTEQSGLIRIRFIVNCKGIPGRYRLISSDKNYQEISFDKRVSNQLISITKSLNGWKIKKLRESQLDYYQYLIFKIEKGRLVKILP